MNGWLPCLETGSLAVLLIFGTPFVAVLGFVVVKILRVLVGAPRPSGQRLQAEEARCMQELFQGLSRLEDRIEALETLLLDRHRKENYP